MVVINQEDLRQVALRSIPSRYLKEWATPLMVWFTTFFRLDVLTGAELQVLDEINDPFGDSRANRLWALSSEIYESDLRILSDMIRQLKWDVGFPPLIEIVRRYTGLDCLAYLSGGGERLSEIISKAGLDSGAALDSSLYTDQGSFPYYIVFDFELTSENISLLANAGSRDLARVLSVYKPVRLDAVFEARVDLLTYPIIRENLVKTTLDVGLALDSGSFLDFDASDISKTLSASVDGVSVPLVFTGNIASFVTKGGEVVVYIQGLPIIEANIPLFPFYSNRGGWVLTIDVVELLRRNNIVVVP